MKVVIITAIVACIALIGGAVYFAVKPKAPYVRVTAVSAAFDQRVKDGYWKKGPEEAQVVQEEFTDFQCPYCYNFYQIDTQAAVDTTANLPSVQRRVYPYPLTAAHNKAMDAAIAAEAAGKQGKYWEMFDLLFSKQGDWSEEVRSAFKQQVVTYAKQLSLNIPDFEDDYASADLEALVRKGIDEGNNRKVTGTPTIYLNGTKVNPPTSYDAWRAQLAASVK